MSDPYGICRWTCGECGDTFEAGGVVGDSKVDRWRREHKEQHRVERMSPEERREHTERRWAATLATADMMSKARGAR